MRALLLVLVISFAFACDKPTDDDCRQAAANIVRVEGAENVAGAPDIEPLVRDCRATFSKAAVKCVITAQTRADIDRCVGKKPDAAPAPKK